jgi:plastocyanin
LPLINLPFPVGLQTDIWRGKVARRLRALRVGLVAVLVVAAAGCASKLSVANDGVLLAPGKWAEANLLLKAGDTISWEWASTQAARFNVHTHEGGSAKDLVDESGVSGRDTFTAPKDGAYSLMWTNASPQPATLTYTITGAGTLDSTYPL